MQITPGGDDLAQNSSEFGFSRWRFDLVLSRSQTRGILAISLLQRGTRRAIFSIRRTSFVFRVCPCQSQSSLSCDQRPSQSNHDDRQKSRDQECGHVRRNATRCRGLRHTSIGKVQH